MNTVYCVCLPLQWPLHISALNWSPVGCLSVSSGHFIFLLSSGPLWVVCLPLVATSYFYSQVVPCGLSVCLLWPLHISALKWSPVDCLSVSGGHFIFLSQVALCGLSVYISGGHFIFLLLTGPLWGVSIHKMAVFFSVCLMVAVAVQMMDAVFVYSTCILFCLCTFL